MGRFALAGVVAILGVAVLTGTAAAEVATLTTSLAVGEAERRATAATVTLGAVQFGELLEIVLYSLVGALGILCVVFRGIGSGIVWAAQQVS